MIPARRIELFVKSPCLHAVFGPPCTTNLVLCFPYFTDNSNILDIVKNVVVVFREAFSCDPSIHPFVSSSIHGWHHTEKKPLQK
jgi:hypothetical protein